MSRSTIVKSLNLHHGVEPATCKFVEEYIVEKPPSWFSTKTQRGVEYIHRPFTSIDQLLTTIQETRALELIKSRDVQVKIADHPFSSDGAVRWPYYALVSESDGCQSRREVVVKRFKTPIGKSSKQVQAKKYYVNQMEVQSVAEFMAEEFNKCTAHVQGVMKIQFTKVSLLHVGGKFYTMEKLWRGERIRYSNDGKYENMTQSAPTLQVFSHWTFQASKGLFMVTGLQGVKQPDKDVPGEHMFCLCDAAVHTDNENVMRFTGTNLGENGFRLFLDNHRCDEICCHLGLPAGLAGYTSTGVCGI